MTSPAVSLPPKPETLWERPPPQNHCATRIVPASLTAAATMTSPAAPHSAHPRKRTKVSLANSSEPSVSSKSDATLKASSALAESTDASDLNSGDESSELSESSEEPSDLSSSEDDDEESTNRDVEAPSEPAVVNLRANRGQKPTYKLDEEDLGPDVRTFLKDFLPQLKAANEELELERKQGALKKREIDAVDGEEDEQYIEMVRSVISNKNDHRLTACRISVLVCSR